MRTSVKTFKKPALALVLFGGIALLAGPAFADFLHNEDGDGGDYTTVESGSFAGPQQDYYLWHHAFRPFDQGFYCDGYGPGCNSEPGVVYYAPGQ